MMVMYDMYNSLQSMERADSMIRQSMDIQRQKEREKIENGMSNKNAASDSSFNEVLQLQKTINQARAKLKLE